PQVAYSGRVVTIRRQSPGKAQIMSRPKVVPARLRARSAARPATVRLRVEVLEDRLAPAVSLLPTHSAQLRGSLADTLGGPALMADGGTLSGSGYAFSNNHGLLLAGGLANTSTYSVVMSLQLATMFPYYKKLIDFQQRTQDVGLY